MRYESSNLGKLDLDPIKVKLMAGDEGEGWSLTKADVVAEDYKHFLFLVLKYPNVQIAPSKEVDTFWHFHILDTMKYARDCQATFGRFLHHFPYLGMRGEEDRRALEVAGRTTRELLRKEFGELCDVAAVNCSGENCTNCETTNCVSSCDSGQCYPNIGVVSRFERPKLDRSLAA